MAKLHAEHREQRRMHALLESNAKMAADNARKKKDKSAARRRQNLGVANGGGGGSGSGSGSGNGSGGGGGNNPLKGAGQQIGSVSAAELPGQGPDFQFSGESRSAAAFLAASIMDWGRDGEPVKAAAGPRRKKGEALDG
jgi:hypothetical protein